MFWVMLFTTGIVAISGGLFIEYKRLKWKHEGSADSLKVQELLAENQEIKRRLSTIEEIITSQEWERLSVASKNEKPSVEEVKKIVS